MKPLRAWPWQVFLVLAVLFSFMAQGSAAQGESQWFWLSSNAKYSKFFDPASVKVTAVTVTPKGRVATEIEAWTKTTYSFGGAEETIKGYEIGHIIADPRRLSYSLALIKINPQNRTSQYVQENFYDETGNVIWSKTDGRVKEINSQEFDEAFYAAIVDEVFRQGESTRLSASDRWIVLWHDEPATGGSVKVTADTSTMRMKGANLILWEWQEQKDKDGKTMDIKFMKKAVNLAHGTERIVTARYWSSSTGWQNMVDDMGGAYRLIPEQSAEYKGLAHLREYVKTNSEWVNRYSLS